MDRSERISHLLARHGGPVPRFLFRYSRGHDRFGSLRTVLVENKWFFSSRKYFDDQEDMVIPPLKFPGVGRKALHAGRAHLQGLWNRLGVLCFSAVLDEGRMWRLYADDGNGVCLRVSCASLKSAYNSGTLPEVPLPIEYSDNPMLTWDVLYDEREPEEIVAASLLRKATPWAYQREWRILRHTGGYGPLPQNALCGLIFGWKVPPATRKEIQTWVELGQRRLPFEEAILDRGSVKVRTFRF